MLTGDTFSLADPGLTAVFKQVYNTPTYRKLLAIETQILASPPNRPIPVNGADFQLTAQAIQKNVLANGARSAAAVRAVDAPARQRVIDLILAAGLGLVAVVASTSSWRGSAAGCGSSSATCTRAPGRWPTNGWRGSSSGCAAATTSTSRRSPRR